MAVRPPQIEDEIEGQIGVREVLDCLDEVRGLGLRCHVAIVANGCDRYISALATNPTAIELGISVIEDATILGNKAIAQAIWSVSHANDRSVEVKVARASEEEGVEREDAAIGCNLPITAGDRVKGHPNHRLVERGTPHGTLELGVTKGKDATVSCHEIVPVPVWC